MHRYEARIRWNRGEAKFLDNRHSRGLEALHHDAHEECYIAHSLKADVVVE